MSSKLEQLRSMTLVVADTGDIEAMRRFEPEDATTNPSLLLKAADLPHYRDLIRRAIDWARDQGGSEAEQLANSSDRLAVDIGREITEIVPGRVSTEVDARLSFDAGATVARARRIIDLYEENDVGRERVLIKIAATWEGIRAAQQLEKENINCNLTLLFGFGQAAACADAGVTLISPFVGRILDWYKANTDLEIKQATDDPGVQSVTQIYDYYKANGYNTIVMGASFRNTGQIESLAGCDRLTISPDLLEALDEDQGVLPRRLSTEGATSDDENPAGDEAAFRWSLNEEAMATEKLAEGIRKFAADQRKLERLLADFPD